MLFEGATDVPLAPDLVPGENVGDCVLFLLRELDVASEAVLHDTVRLPADMWPNG